MICLSLGSWLIALLFMVYWSFAKSYVPGAMHEHCVICVECRIQASLCWKMGIDSIYNTFTIFLLETSQLFSLFLL
ncbi:hypothetical protein BDV26DRAFT_110792 [Aspergillus bertholletiae]|uniref:Secreted protein n=1 Tax=Aspergillus bertholletiae TaxID=1226010 RepID=A0A5N7BHA6_9EURO|nr:hypothetical protein BDV26DRAFT_110792 [Aspergillus bertholletiae]